jgi:hypothetical protein
MTKMAVIQSSPFLQELLRLLSIFTEIARPFTGIQIEGHHEYC